jgi:hypothetical protein
LVEEVAVLCVETPDDVPVDTWSWAQTGIAIADANTITARWRGNNLTTFADFIMGLIPLVGFVAFRVASTVRACCPLALVRAIPVPKVERD